MSNSISPYRDSIVPARASSRYILRRIWTWLLRAMSNLRFEILTAPDGLEMQLVAYFSPGRAFAIRMSQIEKFSEWLLQQPDTMDLMLVSDVDNFVIMPWEHVREYQRFVANFADTHRRRWGLAGAGLETKP